MQTKRMSENICKRRASENSFSYPFRRKAVWMPVSGMREKIYSFIKFCSPSSSSYKRETLSLQISWMWKEIYSVFNFKSSQKSTFWWNSIQMQVFWLSTKFWISCEAKKTRNENPQNLEYDFSCFEVFLNKSVYFINKIRYLIRND